MNKKYREILEKCYAVIGLTFFTGAFDIGLTLSTGAIFPSFIRTGLRYLVWLAAYVFMGFNWKNTLRTARQDILIWLLTAIILLSFIWSDFPLKVLKNNREVLQMSAFALYFATRFSLKEQVKLIAWNFGIALVLSILLGLVMPDLVIHQDDHPGAWRGIYDYKNTFGSMMIMSSLVFFLLPIEQSRHVIYKWIGVSLSLIMIVLSTSKTSLVIYFILVLILLFYQNFRWQGKVSVVILDFVILLVGCVGTLVIGNWVSLITGLGKDPTLTGRTILWEGVFAKLQDRLLLGFGRGAFWFPEGKNGREVGQALGHGFVAPHAHNGLIDLALDVGLIGFSIFLIVYFVAFFRALKRAYATKSPENLWPLAFLIFLAMNNMTESYLLRLSNIYWVLFITVVLSVGQNRSEEA
ncbi:O-antigen ligase family protein [Iningainema tapete]|uniref:O-antigen ligase family protein n=1 Tax=Iningainema tapete BLCC-T55 TaxID=2748662 RepID=A0A8J6XJ93_9CYAN|nr:O-antigen ligase [Iningainema tapete]MBD2777905.1 O-antigen ligase family protein [Iningainema tapete BLCC-T55]